MDIEDGTFHGIMSEEANWNSGSSLPSILPAVARAFFETGKYDSDDLLIADVMSRPYSPHRAAGSFISPQGRPEINEVFAHDLVNVALFQKFKDIGAA